MKKLKALLAGCLALTLLVGCGTNSGSSAEVTVNLGSEPPEMVSFLTTDSTSGNVLRHVMEGLVRLDKDGNPVAGVAEVPTTENGGISEDGKTITFTLNPEATWANGDKITAQDFEYAWDQLFTLKNGAQYASTWAPLIVGAEKLLAAEKDADVEKALAAKGWAASEDGTTFTVQLTGPYSYFVALMAFPNFFPLQEKAYTEAGGIDVYGNDVEGFLGNGAFTIDSWTHESELVLVKNENYWDADSIKLEKITMKMIKETSTANNEYDNGTLDMIGLSGEDIARYTDAGENVQDYADGSVCYFEFNSTVKGLNNAKVRKALTYGFDVPTYVSTVLMNNSTDATTFTPTSCKGGSFSDYVGDLYNRTYDDAQWAQAKKLLDEGLAEEGLTAANFTLTILGDTGDSSKKTYEYFQNQWQKNLGITVKVEQVEFQDRLNRMTNKDFDVVFALWSCDYDDPMSYLDLWVTGGGNNHTSWGNSNYDAAIKAALQEVDQDKRNGYLKTAEEIIADECPIGLIYFRKRSYMTSDRLQGVIRTSGSDLDLTRAYVK